VAPQIPLLPIVPRASVRQVPLRADAGFAATWFKIQYLSIADTNALPNKRLKLAARVDYGMNLSSARRSLSAIR
jgi:hypothetical protein